MNRRDALKSIGVGTILASTTMHASPSPTKESAKESGGKRDFRVLVCGTGFAGLSVAKNLKILNPDISVGIIEKRSHFQSCPYSNACEADILPGNICYSIVNGSPKEGIVVQHEVSYDPKKGLVVKAYDTKKRDTLTGEATTQWFDGIMNDLLG